MQTLEALQAAQRSPMQDSSSCLGKPDMAWGPRGVHLFNPPCPGVVELGKAAVQEGITEETR